MLIDRLTQEISKKSFVCVGLDPKLSYIPEHKQTSDIAETIFNFNKEIIDATIDLAACYKPQIAFYEVYGVAGLEAYAKTVQYIRSQGALVIGDVKRGDIGSTAEAYAKAHFTGDFEVDFITVNPFMGFDTLEPYLPYITEKEKGIFVLVRTSNPGAKDIEYQEVKDEPLYYHIGDQVQKMAELYLGQSGQSSIGFVFGGTHSEGVENVRQRYENIPFLIPGYGAQGARSEDIRGYLGNETGSVVSSSRSIMLHYQNYEDGIDKVGYYARQAVKKMIKDIKGV